MPINEHIDTIIMHDKKLSGFKSKSFKPGGSRWGFIGTYQDDAQKYLVKRESIGSYITVVTEAINDMVVIECLTATLIRKILGNTYAAKTEPVNIDCNSFSYHKNDTSELISESLDYNDLSNYALSSKIFASNQGLQSKQTDLLKLSIIISLLGVTDVKDEHLIKYTRDGDPKKRVYTAIIDCAAKLNGFKHSLDYYLSEKHLFLNVDYDEPNLCSVVLEIFKRFVQIDFSEILTNYEHIPVSSRCTSESLKARLEKTALQINKYIPVLEAKVQERITNDRIETSPYIAAGMLPFFKTRELAPIQRPDDQMHITLET